LLDNYVGYYRLSPISVLTVSRESDHLLARITAQYDFPLFPERADKFFFKNVPAQISFVTGAQGPATALILHQNGIETPAPRIDQAAAQAIEANLTKRVKAAQPIPGSDAALRRQIDGFVQGAPDSRDMTDDLAAITRPQTARIERHFAELGTLQSMGFIGVGTEGWDVYQAKFVNGFMIARIFVTPDGKVSGLRLEWGP
jgi:hypothetical protein